MVWIELTGVIVITSNGEGVGDVSGGWRGVP